MTRRSLLQEHYLPLPITVLLASCQGPGWPKGLASSSRGQSLISAYTAVRDTVDRSSCDFSSLLLTLYMPYDDLVDPLF